MNNIGNNFKVGDLVRRKKDYQTFGGWERKNYDPNAPKTIKKIIKNGTRIIFTSDWDDQGWDIYRFELINQYPEWL